MSLIDLFMFSFTVFCMPTVAAAEDRSAEVESSGSFNSTNT